MTDRKQQAKAVSEPDGMTVGEYAAWLLANFDPDLPIHHRDGGGAFPRLDSDKASSILELRELMRMKGGDYTADTKDSTWSGRREDFDAPFKAAVIWSI